MGTPAIVSVAQAPNAQAIMAICDRAINELQEARTIEEVKRVGDMAAAFAAYTRKIKAALEAQNQCQLVVLLAEARIGAELKAAQDRGEVAKSGQQDRVRDSVRASGTITPVTLPDLGIPRQRASEMKKLAEIGAPAIQEAARVATEAREPLTRSAVFNHRAQGTGENEWYTPAEHIAAARDLLGAIDLDPASSEIANRTVKAASFFTLEDDGLAQPWRGRVWCNPPYAQPHIMRFAEKMAEEVRGGNVAEAVMLTHNYTDTAWFHVLANAAHAICFTRGRISFLSPEGVKAAPTQGQAFFYFGGRVDRFAECFSGFGLVVVRHGI